MILFFKNRIFKILYVDLVMYFGQCFKHSYNESLSIG